MQFYKLKANISRLTVVVYLWSLSFFCFSSEVFATTLDNSTSIRQGFSIGNVDSRSYDASIFNAFAPFSGFLDPNFFSISSFDGGPIGSFLDFVFLSEAAFYDGNHLPGVGNSFGVLDSQGKFQTVFDAPAGPGNIAHIFQDTTDTFTLALKSPTGLYSSIDSNTPDQTAHLLGAKVIKSGQVQIPHANLLGASLSVNLQLGDLLVFTEDLPLLPAGASGVQSDFDFNDLVVAIHQTPIPEPASILLLASGLLFLLAQYRRRVVS